MIAIASFSYGDSTTCKCGCTFLSKPCESVMATSEETIVFQLSTHEYSY